MKIGKQDSNTQPQLTSFKNSGAAKICGGILMLALSLAQGQSQVTQAQVDQAKDTIASRAEAIAILGGDTGASGGSYEFDKNDATFDLLKIGGRFDLGEPRPMGDSSNVKWTPIIDATFGAGKTENDIESGPLAGNESDNDTLATQLGAGARFHFSDRFSLAPSAGVLYSHIENDFDANNPAGAAFASAASDLADGDLDTLSFVPGLEARYQLPTERVTFEFSSHYSYYHTEDIGGSADDVISFSNDSHVWENRLDAIVPLDATLFDCGLSVEGNFSRTELFGDIDDALGDHYYTAGSRLMFNTDGKLWKFEALGLGGAYFFGSDFDGWSFGVEARLKF